MSNFDMLQFPLSERHGLETAGEAVGVTDGVTDGDEVGQIESDKQTPVIYPLRIDEYVHAEGKKL